MFCEVDPIPELGERCEQGENKSLDETAETQQRLVEKVSALCSLEMNDLFKYFPSVMFTNLSHMNGLNLQ